MAGVFGIFSQRSCFILSVWLLSSCALLSDTDSKKNVTFVDKNEERYWELTDKVSQQDRQLKELQSTVNALKVTLEKKEKVAGSVDKKTIAPVAKKSSREITAPDEDPLAPLQESTIVDSRHETMHHYFTGLTQMEEGHYDLALNSFREFLKQNPDHVYADRAEYQIAEAHFLNKDYGLVIVTTNLLENRYPHSFRLPEAIYKRGLSFSSMKQWESARDTYKELLRKYPASPVAKLASQKLGELPRDKTAPQLLQ